MARLDLLNDPEFNETLRPKSSIAVMVSSVREALGISQPTVVYADGLDETVDNALAAFSATSIRQTTVLRITAVTQNAKKSALFANTLVELYIADQLNVKFKAAERTTAWLTNRVAQLKVDLEIAERGVLLVLVSWRMASY